MLFKSNRKRYKNNKMLNFHFKNHKKEENWINSFINSGYSFNKDDCCDEVAVIICKELIDRKVIDFEVIEGWLWVDNKRKPISHTWIEFNDGMVIDPVCRINLMEKHTEVIRVDGHTKVKYIQGSRLKDSFEWFEEKVYNSQEYIEKYTLLELFNNIN
jgi:hypothetical protein